MERPPRCSSHPWPQLQTGHRSTRQRGALPTTVSPDPHSPWLSQVLTFPQGHGQDGSPGLEAFHRAKSLGDRFSLKRSTEMLRSPVDTGWGLSTANGATVSAQGYS